MSENKQIIALLVIVSVIGLGGLSIKGMFPGNENACSLGGCDDVYVNNYMAELELNGSFEETFVYEIKEPGKFRMLYRSWNMPLSRGKIDEPSIEPLTIFSPTGTIPYIKDFQWKVNILNGLSTNRGYQNEIDSLAEKNEAGTYRAERFDAGSYEIKYVFRIYPPLECDANYCHWNFMLADTHLAYKKVEIAINDPGGLIEKIFLHPPMEQKKDVNKWIITGESPKNTLLEIEMLLKPAISGILDGYVEPVSDVKTKTLETNRVYSMNYVIYSFLDYGFRALVIFFPVVLGLIYYKNGREKAFTVPEFLSFVPRKRKPWLVNLVFVGEVFTLDHNGFYSTLLDMHRRQILKIETQNDHIPGLTVTLLKGREAGEDEYETKLLKFLEDHSNDKIFLIDRFKEDIKNLGEKARRGDKDAVLRLGNIGEKMRDLMEWKNKEIAKEFAVSKLYGTLFLVTFLVLIYFLPYFPTFLGSSYNLELIRSSFFILLFQSIPLLFVPSILFGKWKEDYHKEKLEWEAFKKFLSDFVSIRKYNTHDLNMWQEWLVYGTALGAGDKVVDAMKKLNINIPEVYFAHNISTHFGSSYSSVSSAVASTRSGGGFGGGGGSGGGGGGAR